MEKKEDAEEKNQKTVDSWKDYTAALVRWKLTFDLWQQAGNEAFGAAAGVAITMAIVLFALRGKGHPEPLD